jgi:ankyrin repeat protein
MKNLLLGLLASLLPAFALDPAAVLNAIRQDDFAWIKKNITNSEQANTTDSRQNTPLHWASSLGSPEMVSLLLQNGSNPNTQNAFGLSPLMLAATEPAKVQLLLAAGADPKLKAKSGHHALSMAATAPKSTESIRQMLAAGAPVDEPGVIGLTPLLAATFFGCAESNARLLASKGANGKSANAFQYGPAHSAVDCSPELTRQLLAKGANVNQSSISMQKVRHGPIQLDKLTPLHFAAAHGDLERVQLLLDHGAQINQADSRGMTPLIFAVSSEKQDVAVARLLLSKGADRNAKDIYGQDALAWARKFNNPAMLALFGAKPEAAPLVDTKHKGPGLVAALQRLERGNEEFFQESGCVACHANNVTSFAAARAAKAGLAINPQYRANREQRLRAFLNSLAPMHMQTLGPPGDFDSDLYLLLDAKSLALPSSPELELAAKYVLTRQAENGSWSQMGIARAPMEESNIHRTALALYVLPAYLPPAMQAFAQPRFAAAKQWLMKQEPISTDELANKLMGLYWAKAPQTAINSAARALVAAQRQDGSWGGNPHLGGDAFHTGLAIFALRETQTREAKDHCIENAVKWLLATQAEDGTWHVKSRAPKFQPYFESGFPYGHDQWISMAGTAWAIAGLSEAGAIQ